MNSSDPIKLVHALDAFILDCSVPAPVRKFYIRDISVQNAGVLAASTALVSNLQTQTTQVLARVINLEIGADVINPDVTQLFTPFDANNLAVNIGPNTDTSTLIIEAPPGTFILPDVYILMDRSLMPGTGPLEVNGVVQEELVLADLDRAYVRWPDGTFGHLTVRPAVDTNTNTVVATFHFEWSNYSLNRFNLPAVKVISSYSSNVNYTDGASKRKSRVTRTVFPTTPRVVPVEDSMFESTAAEGHAGMLNCYRALVANSGTFVPNLDLALQEMLVIGGVTDNAQLSDALDTHDTSDSRIFSSASNAVQRLVSKAVDIIPDLVLDLIFGFAIL